MNSQKNESDTMFLDNVMYDSCIEYPDLPKHIDTESMKKSRRDIYIFFSYCSIVFHFYYMDHDVNYDFNAMCDIRY